MKWITVFLEVVCAVSCIAQVPEAVKPTNFNDDRWIWGPFIDPNNKNKTENRNKDQLSTNEPFGVSTDRNDICSFYDPPIPSFSKPGRTISEEKCEEYKWERALEEERQRRNAECYALTYKDKAPPPAAVGGRITYLGEFPHMGAIGWKLVQGGYVFKCGSTLISTKFVLTAAHCSKASLADTTLEDVVPKIIRLNDKNLLSKGDDGYQLTRDFEISRIIVHPKYKSPKKYFDIALMELQHEVQFSWLMRPACLWTKPEVSELGHESTLTGWGVLHSGSYDTSPELQAADVHNINSSFCDELLYSSRNRHWWGLQEHQLCAGKLAGGVDACQGDSGGPLQVKQNVEGTLNQSIYYIIGVTSFGIGCALPNHPGIYTRVSSFLDWIEGYVWP